MPDLIPTFESPFYEQLTALDGVPYLLSFQYNTRESRWYFSVALQDGTEIVTGIKVVCSIGLLRRFADRRLPPGDIVAVSAGADGSPPGLTELGEGKRVQLLYYSEDEIEALRST